MRVSVLDTSPIVAGSTARQALRNTVDLALLADELGFHRYWVPEHHAMRGVASTAPAVVAGRLADSTRRIRVGAGGVLLPNHPPLVVAEQFGTLAAFHPGRIDLGLGRALGGPPRIAGALRRTDTDFRAQLEELIGHFGPEGAVPAAGNSPELWILGSGPTSAELAGALGLPYAFAHHLNPAEAVRATRIYRTSCAVPSVLLSVAVIVAETTDRAEWLALPHRVKVLNRKRGTHILLPSPDDAAAAKFRAAELAECTPGLVAGDQETVRKSLQALIDDTGADELMVTTPVFDHTDRRRSYELAGELSGDLRSPG